MKLLDDKILLSFSDLNKSGISEGSIKSARFRKTKGWTFIKDPDDKRKVLVMYDDLRDKYKRAIRRKIFGGVEPYEAVKTKILDKHLKLRDEDMEFFMNYEGLTEESRKKGIEAARYLFIIYRCRTPRQRRRIFPSWSTKDFWSTLIKHIRSNPHMQGDHKGINFPMRKEKLQSLAGRFMKEGPEVLISGRLGNKNTIRLGRRYQGGRLMPYDETIYKQQIAIIAELAAHPNNHFYTNIAEKYNKIAKKLSWPELSIRSIEYIVNSGEIHAIISGGRYGKGYFRNNLAIQIKRRRPSAPLLYITIDGWEVELHYQERVYDSRGNSKMIYDRREVVVIILDAFNNYPLGYAIGDQENTDLIKRAYKNAVDHIHELTGDYWIPYQVQSDNYGRKIMSAFYKNVTHIYTPAAVGNAKSKVIEPYFKYLNNTYCKEFDNWSGYGITARREHHPNREFKDKIKKSFPDKNGVIRQIEWIIEKEREKKRDAYMQHIDEGKKIRMDERAYLRTFGTPTRRTIRMQPEGFILKLDGVPYAYETFDEEFYKLRHLSWQAYYDAENMDHLLVRSEDEKHEFVLMRKYEQPMAIYDQTEEDREQLQKVRQFNKDYEQRIIEARRKNYEIIEDIFYRNPELEEYRKLFMFTQKGQMKDEIYAVKASISEKKKRDPLPPLPPPSDDPSPSEIERRHMEMMKRKFEEFERSLKKEDQEGI